MEQFRLKHTTIIEEQNGILYEYEHTISKARILWLQTAENNKLFSVTFRTVPEDNTGVFHILEHSVLCGSKNYPVKDPSLELEKGSVNTYLNAMTYADHTIFPVSSRNEKDFFHLMKVYLDAVFCPLIYENPLIFYQEGWHYEIDPLSGVLSVNGVVYNEMKGVEASVDARIHDELKKLLYPDTCYRYSFGGNSREIPDLSYDKLLKKHQQFYRPDNAIFYLEGNLDIEKVFSVMEVYLKEPSEPLCIPEIKKQEEIPASKAHLLYPVAEDESLEDHTQVLFGKRLAYFKEREKIFAAMILSDYLTGSMESPLTNAVLSNQSGCDVQMSVEEGTLQPYIYIQITNTETSCVSDIQELLAGLADEIIESGSMREELEAILTNFEFKSREHEEPRALHHNLDVLESYLYGGSPAEALSYKELFQNLRKNLETDYYEKLLIELLDVKTLSVVIAEASHTKNQEEQEEEKQKCDALLASWDDNKIQEIKTQNARLESWQAEADPDWRRKMVPSLQLEDLEPLPEKKQTEEIEVEGVKILVHPMAVSDAAYLNLYFPVPAKYQDQLENLSLLGNLLLDMPTEKYDSMSLYQKIVGTTGDFSVEFLSVSRPGHIKDSRVYFAARICFLKEKARDAIDLLCEVLLHTKYEDEEMVSSIFNQLLDGFRNEMIENGNVMGARAALSSWSSMAGATEMLEGDRCYQNLKRLCEGGEEQIPAFLKWMQAAAKELFTLEQMVIGFSVPEKDWEQKECLDGYGLKELVHRFPKGSQKDVDMHIALKKKNHFIPIPSTVSYAAAGLNINALDITYSAAWQVAVTILSLEYLWNVIRVQGGAYGTGVRIGCLGNLSFYTYRDPSGKKSLEVFRKSGRFLKEFVKKEGHLERYIISTVSGMNPLLAPRDQGIAADTEYLCGIDYEKLCEIYQAALRLTKEDLLDAAEKLDSMADQFTECLVGGE